MGKENISNEHAMDFLMWICENALMMKIMKKLLGEIWRRDHITSGIAIANDGIRYGFTCTVPFISTLKLNENLGPRKVADWLKAQQRLLGQFPSHIATGTAGNIITSRDSRCLKLWRNILWFTKSRNAVLILKA